jgi:hypothetical protein
VKEEVVVKEYVCQRGMSSGWQGNKRNHHPLGEAKPAVSRKELLLERNWTAHGERNRKPGDTKKVGQTNQTMRSPIWRRKELGKRRRTL